MYQFIDLEAQGESCHRAKAGTPMKLVIVAAKQKKKFEAITDSKHNLPVVPNLNTYIWKSDRRAPSVLLIVPNTLHHKNYCATTLNAVTLKQFSPQDNILMTTCD